MKQEQYPQLWARINYTINIWRTGLPDYEFSIEILEDGIKKDVFFKGSENAKNFLKEIAKLLGVGIGDAK